MKTKILILLTTLLVQASLNAQVLLHDNFSGSTVNTNLWSITLPENDASVTESGGYVSLENAGRLVSQNSLPASYAIEGKFLMTNNPYSNFKVMLRTDGVSLPSPHAPGVYGIEIQFNILDDDGNPSNNLKICADMPDEGIELGVVAANLTLDTWHTFRITDDGTNIALFFDGSSMPNLTASSTYSAGNKIALLNREGAGNGSSISANGITEIDYITVYAIESIQTRLFVSPSGDDTLGNGTAGAPFATIQKAVDIAPTNGALALISVLPGTYSGTGNNNINLEGKVVLIQSTGGPGVTTLNCQQNQAFIAHSNETTDTVIDGFTITNGFASSGQDWDGIGIVDIRGGAGLTIKDCVFTDNSLNTTYITTSAAIIMAADAGNTISIVNNCLFYNNTISAGAWGTVPFACVIGSCGSGGTLQVLDCTIANNNLISNGLLGGFPILAGSSANDITNSEILNTIIFGNTTNSSSYVNVVAFANIIGYSISDGLVSTNGQGTSGFSILSSNPLFINPAVGDYSTATNSPARNAGDPSLPNNPDGSRSDIGWRQDRFVPFPSIQPPVILVPFTGAITYWGENATLSVGALGFGPLSYQWYDNGVEIPNATNQTLNLSSIQFTNAGLYSVVVNSPWGSVTNTPAQVVVNTTAGVSVGFCPSLTISGVTGYSYIIQSSTNLTGTNAWVTLTNLTLTQPVQLFIDMSVDASSPFNPQTFYRILPGQ